LATLSRRASERPMPSELRAIEGGEGLAYELELDAPPPVVWRFWTERDELIRWMGDGATIEPWPGGTLRVEYGSGDVAVGTFLDVEAHQYMAFTWGWDEAGALTPPGTSRIEVILEAVSADTRTLLRFRHVNQPAAALENHDAGWRFFLPRLAEAVAATQK
jgi:uncharacterized protein YndB with AHSA1/START domain